MIYQKRGRLEGNPPNLVVPKPQRNLKEILDNKKFRVLGANIQGNMSWQNHLEKG